MSDHVSPSARPAGTSGADTVLAVENLHVRFVGDHAANHAVNGVGFTLRRGEVLSLLGESGSGKSVTLRALMRLLPNARSRVTGQAFLGGQDLLKLDERALARIRGARIAMVFQEPMTAFDPVYTVGQQIVETIVHHEGTSRAEAKRRALELLDMVQIPSPARRLAAYPHEMSGGMRQRAMIALALSCRPDILLADEPTTALDVTVQIQILLLLRRLREELGMAMLFVTHDVGVAVEIADRVAVMYAGRFVETGPMPEVLKRHCHPYTDGLLRSTVMGRMRGERLAMIPGAPPHLTGPPQGCSFAPRCSLADEHCRLETPTETNVGENHTVRCFRHEPAPPSGKSTHSAHGSAP